MNPFEEKIRQLRAGEIDKIEVTRDEFFLFREAWIKQEDKKFFRGIAGIEGKYYLRLRHNDCIGIDFFILYRYHKKEFCGGVGIGRQA